MRHLCAPLEYARIHRRNTGARHRRIHSAMAGGGAQTHGELVRQRARGRKERGNGATLTSVRLGGQQARGRRDRCCGEETGRCRRCGVTPVLQARGVDEDELLGAPGNAPGTWGRRWPQLLWRRGHGSAQLSSRTGGREIESE